jgi:hypothetical protein
MHLAGLLGIAPRLVTYLTVGDHKLPFFCDYQVWQSVAGRYISSGSERDQPTGQNDNYTNRHDWLTPWHCYAISLANLTLFITHHL